ncbi:MAG TPA: type VI secretion system contractile sheath small subunit, partial [Bryobacteraceae bacterium]|nr:type VI secretion system contractile sheath small subunit [Bryobacteraceae bacterium]
MAKASTQQKLSRVRPPRVHVTYDVEIGDAIELKELPFVMGVLGDFTGQPTEPLPRLRDRKFVEVNPDNFDQVLEGMKPHLSYSVENKLSEEPDAPNLKVDLHFKSMDDFEPENVARQVKPLKELLDLRQKLADLRGSLQGN